MHEPLLTLSVVPALFSNLVLIRAENLGTNEHCQKKKSVCLLKNDRTKHKEGDSTHCVLCQGKGVIVPSLLCDVKDSWHERLDPARQTTAKRSLIMSVH